VKEDGLHTFSITPAPRTDLGAVHVLLYLLPTGAFSNLTQKVIQPEYQDRRIAWLTLQQAALHDACAARDDVRS